MPRFHNSGQSSPDKVFERDKPGDVVQRSLANLKEVSAILNAKAPQDLWEPLRFALVPNAVKRARAHEKAVEQFLAQNLHTTRAAPACSSTCPSPSTTPR